MQYDINLETGDISKEFDKVIKKTEELGAKLDKVTAKFNNAAAAASNYANAVGSGGAPSSGNFAPPPQVNPGPPPPQVNPGPPPVHPGGPAPAPGGGGWGGIGNAISAGQGVGSPAGAARAVGFVVQNLHNPVVITAAAITAFGVAVVAVTHKMDEFGKLNFATGGKASAEVASLASAAGVDPAQAAADAARLPGGGPDLVRRLKLIREAYKQNPMAGRNLANKWGLGQYSNLNNLSEGEFSRAASGQGFGFDADQINAAADAQSKYNRGINDFTHLISTVVTPALEGFNKNAGFVDWIKGVAMASGIGGLNKLGGEAGVGKVGDFAVKGLTMGAGAVIQSFIDALTGKDDKSADKMARAADKMDGAADKMQQAAVKDGTYGPGGRKGGAYYPEMWDYNTKQDNMRRAARALGERV